MLCFLLVSGVTTDICETIGCLLFLGLTLRSINLHAPRRARVGSARIAFERLRYGAGVIAPNAR
ncbi:major facilitator superfamily permease [Burkholderia pseudomallei]|nr:major facilitator superfamily permease [Burkholderia pseudomallei]